MKQFLILVILVLSTGLTYMATAQTTAKKVTRTKVKVNPDVAVGMALISKSDCLSCHRPIIKLIGPSFRDIAKKYPDTLDNNNLLVKKIINGGSGVWGPVAMSPHSMLSVTDVKKMVAYILSVK